MGAFALKRGDTMPLTEKGFERQTYDEILSVQIERAKILFGEDIDTSENSTFGKILRLFCMDAAEYQETAEKVYFSAFPNTASGVSLDRLCPLVGVSRNPATYAQHTITVSGEAGAVVPMGFLVSAGEVVFHTVDNYIIDDAGTVEITVECNDAGTVGNVAAGAITEIVNPIADVSGIEHTAISKLADDIETDYELRKRFSQALSGTGSGTLEAIKGAIMRVSGVESVLIQENFTAAEVDGIPAHSFRCYVLAPKEAEKEIAKAIFDKKPVGVATAGSESVVVIDADGGMHYIRFSWTEEVNIHVKCSIKTNSSYSADSLEQIKSNIVSKLAGYENGQSVTATSLYAAVYVDGVTDVTSLEISSDGENYGTSAVTIANNKVARTIADNIEVTVVE